MTSFDGLLSRLMNINTRYVVYDGLKVGILYSRDVYDGH